MTTKRNIVNIIIALLIIAIGVILIGNAIGVWDINVFFKGWWAAALMLMFLIFVINDSPNIFNVGGLVAFGIILLDKVGVIPENINVWLIILAAVLIVIGLRLIFPQRAKKLNLMTGKFEDKTVSAESSASSSSADDGVSANISVTFGSESCSYTGRNYAGGSFTASFGELSVDLRGASISEAYNTQLSASFGKLTVYVDSSVKIDLKKSAVFGAVSDYTAQPAVPSAVLHMEANSAFGEIVIRNS